jgi:hypothetical protein
LIDSKLGVGREDYYLHEIANDEEAYLNGHGEAPGRWSGRAAGEHSASGMVTAEQFKAMFTGHDP